MSTSLPDAPAALPDLEVRGALTLPSRLAGRYVMTLRRRHPGATPGQIIHVLEKQFLLAMSVGTAGTGVAGLRARRLPPLLGLSAAHLGAAGALATFYLLCLSHVYALGDVATRALIGSCAVGGDRGGILEQQFAGTWWRSAAAFLPVSQARYLNNIAARSLRRAAAKGGVSRMAPALPAGIGLGVGFTGGRIAANRVVSAAAAHLGVPPSAFSVPASPAVCQ